MPKAFEAAITADYDAQSEVERELVTNPFWRCLPGGAASPPAGRDARIINPDRRRLDARQRTKRTYVRYRLAGGGKMGEMRDDSCEMKRRGEWTGITIEDALNRHSDKKMRCPACHGRVQAIRSSINGRAHFEHNAGHAGCPRGDSYSGAPSPHPDPL